MSGVIALDIDGTVTTESTSIPDEVLRFLKELYQDGWAVAFITGRSLAGSQRALKGIPFPYFLAVQNGAIILSMPSREIVFRHYIEKATLLNMTDLCQNHATDVVVFSGAEFDDVCYYRPRGFHQRVLDYVYRRRDAYDETWHSLDSFSLMPIEAFASTKSFGTYEELLHLHTIFENDLNLHAPINRDPFQEEWYVLQTTSGAVSKGQAVKDLRVRCAAGDLVIAAGDDLNDLPLLQAADIKIAMGNAPRPLLDIADIIAPPASQYGIIPGLKQAIGAIRG
jgi:Cof subfamily protein (haloacid dehalogenase superfamily)